MNKRLLKSKLEAFVDDGHILYELLQGMTGQCLADTYQVTSLFDVGGQGILFQVRDKLHPQVELLVKLPFLNYHRSAYLGDQGVIQRAYDTIIQEADILRLFSGTILPECYDFFEIPDPLLDRWWKNFFTVPCPCLVMEHIQGHSLDDEIGYRHRMSPVDFMGLESLAWEIATDVLELFAQLYHCHLLYTDMRPVNILLADTEDQRGKPSWLRQHRSAEIELPLPKVDTQVRVIDGGSIASLRRHSAWPMHMAYVPSDFYARHVNGESLPEPGIGFVLYTLGKTLYQLVSAKEPIAGVDPDFGLDILLSYSQPFRQFLLGLIVQEYASFEQARAALTALKSLTVIAS